MTQKEDESLEDYMERFQYNLQMSKHSIVDKDTPRTIMIRVIRDKCFDILNLMGAHEIA